MTLSRKDLVDSFQIDMASKDSVHMDVGYMDGVVAGQGLRFSHYRAIPCPVGMGDPYDIRKTHADHAGCSGGHLYEYAGEMTCLFSGNGKEIRSLDVGLVTGSTVQLTVPRLYEGTDEEVYLSPYDRFYLKEGGALVVTFQRLEHNISGFDRTNFPIVKVEHIVDADGVSYHVGRDFEVLNGQIHWTSRQPGMDPATGKGLVIAVRYRYIPFWYVDRILHEIRMVQGENPETGEQGPQRMPYSVLLQREYIFETEANDPRSIRENSPRQQTAPRSGAFGPR